MRAGAKKRGDKGAAKLQTLRSVLVATGGNAKVEELYRLRTAAEAAHFLGLAESTVRDMTYRKVLPCVKVGLRGVRYRVVDLIGWQEERSQPSLR